MGAIGLCCAKKELAREIEKTALPLMLEHCPEQEWLPIPWQEAADLGGQEQMLFALILYAEGAQAAFDLAAGLWAQQPSLRVICVVDGPEEVFSALAHPFFHVVRSFALETDLSAAFQKLERQSGTAQTWYTFECRAQLVRVKGRELLYLESDRHDIQVHAQRETFSTLETLAQCEEKLKGGGFVRIHKSFLVNLYHVESLAKDSLLLSNGERLYISRYRYPEVKRLFEQYIRRLEFI